MEPVDLRIGGQLAVCGVEAAHRKLRESGDLGRRETGRDRSADAARAPGDELLRRGAPQYDERLRPGAGHLGGALGEDEQARGGVVAGRIPQRSQRFLERLRVFTIDRCPLDHCQAVDVLGAQQLRGLEDLGTELLERLPRRVRGRRSSRL